MKTEKGGGHKGKRQELFFFFFGLQWVLVAALGFFVAASNLSLVLVMGAIF